MSSHTEHALDPKAEAKTYTLTLVVLLILTGITNKNATFDVTKPAPACLGSKNNVPLSCRRSLRNNDNFGTMQLC